MSLFNEYVTRKLKRLLFLNDDSGQALPAGKVLVTTGVGSRAVLSSFTGLGSWLTKVADFEMQPQEHYLVEVNIPVIEARLPLFPWALS